MSDILADPPRDATARTWSGHLGIALAVLLLLATLLFMLYREETVRVQQIEQIRVQAHILAGSVTAALAFNDPRTAQEFLSSLSAVPSLRAGAVYDSRGLRIAAFARGANTLPDRVDTRATILVDSDVIVTVPVTQGGTPLGHASVMATLEAPDRRIARFTIMAALIILASLAIGALVVGQTAWRRHSQQLAQANRKLKDEMAQRERAEEALRQSQKMEAIGQLAGGIAHDFNNLLGVIQGNLHLLQKRLAQGRTDTEKYWNATKDAIGRAATLTQRILAYSRRQPLSPSDVDLSKLVAGLADLLKHSVNERVTLELRLESRWHVMCDANQMESVVLNLANNAGDAMPDGGKLLISTADVSTEASDEVPKGDYVELKVADSGLGMDDATRRQATDPFFTTKPLGRGTGLGLSTALGYVRQSQGFLHIDSAPGRGTTITILMPRRRSSDPE
jgi:signal transduction histidine kinase